MADNPDWIIKRKAAGKYSEGDSDFINRIKSEKRRFEKRLREVEKLLASKPTTNSLERVYESQIATHTATLEMISSQLRELGINNTGGKR
jgi:hypothetical protein